MRASPRPSPRHEKVGFRPVGLMREYWRSPDELDGPPLMEPLSRDFGPAVDVDAGRPI